MARPSPALTMLDTSSHRGKELDSDCTFVIFGATGNLCQVKLMPALYHLELAGKLPENLHILACGRREWSTEYLTDKARQWIAEKARGQVDENVLDTFCSRLEYFRGDLDDVDMYARLASHLANQDSNNLAFYMAIAPQDFGAVTDQLSANNLLDESQGWRRVVIEKPFGFDLESAQALQRTIADRLDERQVFRIDHYLGKGMVQNVLVFRFANLLMEPLWNRTNIDHVQITHSEKIGVGTRGNYYDHSGALRDMLQSHLMQLLTLIAMEAPVSMAAEDLRDEKVKVLKSIRPISQDQVQAQAHRAQYLSGEVDGETVCGYLEEEGIPDSSNTETYAALKLYIDNWRWRDVPFYLRTGKRMQEAQSMISICFKQPPQQFFKDSGLDAQASNWLVLGIQPQECLRLEMTVKEAGLEMQTRIASLDASFAAPGQASMDAYENLLLDVMEGDQSLFLRWDEVEWAWRVVEPVLQAWAADDENMDTYKAGSWGAIKSRRLFDNEEVTWRHSIGPEDYTEK